MKLKFTPMTPDMLRSNMITALVQQLPSGAAGSYSWPGNGMSFFAKEVCPIEDVRLGSVIVRIAASSAGEIFFSEPRPDPQIAQDQLNAKTAMHEARRLRTQLASTALQLRKQQRILEAVADGALGSAEEQREAIEQLLLFPWLCCCLFFPVKKQIPSAP